jgi:carboxyl-terminal processing protease
MQNQLEVVRDAYRVLVDESRIPVDAKRVSEAALSAHGDAETPWAAVRAMARAVDDPHTILISPAVGAQMMAFISGGPTTLPGFAMHRTADGRFVVGDVTAGGSAAAAGLAPGDVVVSIDGSPVSRNFEDQVDFLNRTEGSAVPIQIVRGGERRELGVTVTPAQPPLVESKLLAPHVGYVRLRLVTTSEDPARDSATLVQRAIAELGGPTLRGVVLDLRSNPGGYGVTRLASVLTDREQLARYRDAAGNEELGKRTDVEPACNCPIVVLVDDQTLSSAELVALALQDHGVARVVGQPTAGGLNVPRRVPLGDHILMTPERMAIGPSTGRVPDGMRVHPDIIGPNRTPEDFASGRDPQLACALELLGR